MRPPDRVVTPAGLRPGDEAGWARLVAEGGHSYFSGPAWCRSWWECLAPAACVEIGIWDGHDGPAAVAPMARVAEPLLPGGRAARLAVPVWQNAGAGAGSADHLGFPSVPALRTSALRWALDRPGTIRLLHLDGSWAPELGAVGPAVDGVATYATSLEGSPRPGSRKLWKHIARSRRQLVGLGVGFDLLLGTEIDRAALEGLFSLHGVRSSSAGRRTTFTDARLGFHAALAARSTSGASSFLLRATGPDGLVGALYGFVEPDRVSYYQSGWDPSLERLSLGSVLIGEAIDWAVERGARTFDLLRGDEPYKLRFGAEVVEDRSLVRPRGASGWLLRGRSAATSAASAASRRNGGNVPGGTGSP